MKKLFLMLPLVFGLSFVACGDDDEISEPKKEQTDNNQENQESSDQENENQEGSEENNQEQSPEDNNQENTENNNQGETPEENNDQQSAPSLEDLSKEQGVSISGTIGNYTYVDLGSDVLWATYNIGANAPTEIGDYFAWGETSPKDDYDTKTYQWLENGRYTKYIKNTGRVEDYEILQPSDDAAIVNWGESWRTPLKTEISNLIRACNWEWTENFMGSGVNGMLGTSKTNGNTIFLPTTGYRVGEDYNHFTLGGHYWSAILAPDYIRHATALFFDSSMITVSYTDRGLYVNEARWRGLCIRAVSPKN